MAEPTSMTLGTPIIKALTGTTSQSAAIGTANPGQPLAYTTVRTVCTADAWIATGTNPTAVSETAGSFYLPAGVVEYIDLPFGFKVAGVVADTGVLSLTPCTKG